MNADIVILCAGGSTRLGSAKQHIRLFGKPLLQRACELAVEYLSLLGANRPALVITGPYARDDEQLLSEQPQCEGLNNPNWQSGLNSSLACAIDARAYSDALLVLLVDQYRLHVQDLLLLNDHWRQHPADPVAASYAGTVGPPVIWPADYFARLKAHSGAPKDLLMTVRHRSVEMPHAAEDLDNAADLADLKSFEQSITANPED